MATPDNSQFDEDDAIAALERFVVENDELRLLEEQIGRFNIFDALKIVHREIKHSDFLAWLLDPNESHGQGGLFLRAILMDLFKSARASGFSCPASPIELDGEELRGVEVRREWRNIDLLIICDQPDFVVAIENKIKSGEHSDQLNRYRDLIVAEFAVTPCMYVFLTIDGDQPSKDDWVPYSYGDLHRVLTRVRNANETSIGHDVLAFLDHYLRLIRGRLMHDPEIANLCQRIYKNHRTALQLIYDLAGSPAAGLLGRIEQIVLEHPGSWHVVNKTATKIHFLPSKWLDLLPAIGSSHKVDARCWILLRIELGKKKALFGRSAWPTCDPELRGKVIDRLTRNRNEFGFSLFFKTTSAKWSQLGKETIATWSVEDEPNEEALLEAVRKKLDELIPKLRHVPKALRPVLNS